MGIRVDQVNLNSFKKVFPLRSDVSNVVLSTIETSESIIVEKNDETLTLHLNPATNSQLGGVMVGGNISCTEGIISVPFATSEEAGVIKVGENINYENDTISLNKASKETFGLVRVGENIRVEEGVISVDPINVATKTNAGIVKPGAGINVDEHGEISISDGTKSNKGLVQIGSNIDVTSGVISVKTSDKSNKGLVQVGSNIDVTSGVISVKTATKTEKGLVQAGENIDIDAGVISVKTSNKSNKGLVRIGENIDVSNGTISVKIATKTEKGLVQAGENINITNGIISTDVSKDYVDSEVSKLTAKDTELQNKINSLESTITRQTNEITSLKESVSTLERLMIASTAVIEELTTRIEMLESIVAESLLELRPLIDGAFYIGSITLNGYNSPTNIKLPSKFTNGNYRICLTPNSPTDGNLGEIWVSQKTAESFTVVNTGRGSMIKTDFLIMTDETSNPSFNASSFPYLKGTGRFNGTTGASVTITNIGTTDYKVLIFPVKASSTNEGDLGEYWVSNKTATGFKVYNTGKDVVSNFDYIVIKSGNPTYDRTSNPIMEGSGTFAGHTSSTVINFTETEFESNNYSVLITPTSNTNGDLGEYWIERKTTTSFTVKNTGTSTGTFDYVIVG